MYTHENFAADVTRHFEFLESEYGMRREPAHIAGAGSWVVYGNPTVKVVVEHEIGGYCSVSVVNLHHVKRDPLERSEFDLDEIVAIGQAFAEAVERKMPSAGFAKSVFEIGTEAGGVYAARPAFTRGAALITVTAEKRLLGFDISEARNLDAVGAIAKFVFVFVAGNDAVGAAAHDVVHQVAAQFAAGVGEAIGEFGSC